MEDMAMNDDLNEKMTSEQIKEYAEKVFEESQAERKSDAEIIADTAPVEKIAAENKSSRKAAEDTVQSEDGSGDESSAPEWVTDDVKAEVAAYGIDESDLSDFASREELDRALRLFDKKALDSGRKALSDDKPSKQEASREDQKPVAKDSGKYEVTLSKDLYDDEIVDEFSRMRDHYEARLERLEANLVQATITHDEARFDGIVDQLGHADLFGKTGKETEKELERRKELRIAIKAHLIGMEQLGHPVEENERLYDRVAGMVFADEIGKKRLKQHTQKISRQSGMRLGGSPTKPQPPSEDPREAADRLYRELERA
jgi:hypothetical protein